MICSILWVHIFKGIEKHKNIKTFLYISNFQTVRYSRVFSKLTASCRTFQIFFLSKIVFASLTMWGKVSFNYTTLRWSVENNQLKYQQRFSYSTTAIIELLTPILLKTELCSPLYVVFWTFTKYLRKVFEWLTSG